jgi:hypothetical protein
MLRKEIKVGKYYWAKLDGLRFTVVVERIEEVRRDGERITTVYHVKEPHTGHRRALQSARDFYREIEKSSFDKEAMKWKRKKQREQPKQKAHEHQMQEDHEQQKQGKQKRRSVPQQSKEQLMSRMNRIITNSFLEQGRGKGWSREQLQMIGVEWPLVKGWKQQIIGTEISEETASLFLRLVRKQGKQKRQSLGSRVEQQPWAGASDVADAAAAVEGAGGAGTAERAGTAGEAAAADAAEVGRAKEAGRAKGAGAEETA